MSNFEEITGFIEHLGDAIIITNDLSEIAFANSACLDLFGYTEHEMRGMSIDQIMSEKIPNHSVKVKQFIQNHSKARTMMARGIMPCVDAIGKAFNARISIASVTIDNQLFGVATIQDFSSLQAELEQLEITSNQDMLTGLYNRRYLQKIITPESRLMQTWKNIGVIYMDLNKFKPINDKYGHDVGDTVLNVISKRLKGCVRFDDVVFRMGGDEFLVFLNMNNVKDRKEAILRVAKNIQQVVIKAIKTEHVNVSVGLSAGYGLYPEHEDDIQNLINLTDKAMYSAKESGGGIKIVK